MTVPTMIERTPNGFRASTTAGPVLSADAATAVEALAALQRLVGNDRVAGVPRGDDESPFAAPIGDDPWFPEFLAACAENRRLADESAAESAG